MNTHADKTQENKSRAVANNLPQQQSNSQSTFQFIDNRPEAITQKELQKIANNSPQAKQLKTYQAMADNYTSQTAQPKENLEEETLQGKFEPVQEKENNTGLPDNLKTGMENLSGIPLNDVKVHYNSDKPAQLNAHAYAQGTDIHLGAGQEKHLPHEAWHIVQQKQGRVQATLQMKGSLAVNDDPVLEREADVMGEQAMQKQSSENAPLQYHKQALQLQAASVNNTAYKIIQPVWVNYHIGNIFMWDRKIDGLRWYYISKEDVMYYQIESPDALKRALGMPVETEEPDNENTPDNEKMEAFRKQAGMENSRTRDKWMEIDLFGQEEHEPEPAPVVQIEELSHQITAELQPQAFGKLESMQSGVDSESLLSSPVEHTPLFNLIHKAANSLGISVWELELRLGSPTGYYNSFKSDKERAGKSSGLFFENLEVGNISTFKEYMTYLIKEKKLTGSCGQTSSWIHRITGGLLGKDGGQETPLPVPSFLEVLNSHKSQRFYMRVLTGGHSFIIESSGTSMAIYQSWHGSAPMAFMLEQGLNKMSPGDMIGKLEEVLLPKNSMIGQNPHRDKSSEELFYGQDHKNPTPLVWFNINLNLLSSEQIQTNIIASLSKYQAQWEYAESERDMEMMDIAEQPDKLGPESSPKDMSQILGEKDLHSDLHKGLTYLHTHQVELRDNPDAFKPAVIEAPKAEEQYILKSVANATQVLKLFQIKETDVEGGASSPNELMRPVTFGKLLPGNYTHKTTGRTYSLTKEGQSIKTVYTFKIVK